MIEKILERLEERKDHAGKMMSICDSMEEMDYYYALTDAYNECKEIVQEVAKECGKDTNVRSNWIPTAEMLFPRYGQKVLASVRTDISTHEVIITTYERQEYWHNGIITAWQPLPQPYQKGE